MENMNLGSLNLFRIAKLFLAQKMLIEALFIYIFDIIYRITRVQYLDLSMATITTEGLEELLANTHYLRKLSLENCEVNDAICRWVHK